MEYFPECLPFDFCWLDDVTKMADEISRNHTTFRLLGKLDTLNAMPHAVYSSPDENIPVKTDNTLQEVLEWQWTAKSASWSGFGQ